jgi:hypothetical protein
MSNVPDGQKMIMTQQIQAHQVPKQLAKLPDFILTGGHEKIRIAKGPPSCLDGENFKARNIKHLK